MCAYFFSACLNARGGFFFFGIGRGNEIPPMCSAVIKWDHDYVSTMQTDLPIIRLFSSRDLHVSQIVHATALISRDAGLCI